ncbi:MAG TPA: hypothetical protein IAC39_01405 [Candidatus Faeciplasma pullistercoris]|uniref:Uncharacterized protein n=1 Tax=Candidatus Faeciplasma pullistercoris TaxID=2840800 RepID=A0A9D1KJN9_9FIRM|nr:hypothetical protein [Candidatus Faeciplasma pullistercoris]
MRELIENYKAEVERLEQHSKKLAQMIKTERDIDIVNGLTARKKLIDIEKFELLTDIRSMQEYVG